MPPYDAILLVSFGGPEGPDDVLPFLERVTRGRGVPEARLRTVAEQYLARGGVSPINDQCRTLLGALGEALAAAGHALPLYWGNRNWHPFLADTLGRMTADGIGRALAVATSAFSSYSGCRQYLEDIEAARAAAGPGAPIVEKLPPFFAHPGFIEAMADNVQAGLAGLAEPPERVRLVFTAHSLPVAMARTCDYEAQLREAARLVLERIPPVEGHDLVYQSRSGPPTVPWLEPDVADHLRALAAAEARAVLLVPIGFVSDHMEVVQDLDVVALGAARECELAAARVPTVGTHPRFVRGLVELIEERLTPGAPRRRLGTLAPLPDVCAAGCCPPPAGHGGHPAERRS